MIKKIIAVFIAIVIVFGTIPIDVFANNSQEPAKFEDMPENWSRTALENAVENGLLSGVDGKIMPNEKLTRAQMATVITRAFGAKDKGNISKFSDVKASDWFYDSMSKAYKMGVIKGSNNKLNPKEPITRQEAFVMIARAFKLEPADVLNKSFEDTDQISDWAKEEVYSVINNEYIQGSNGKINPKGNITRAEFAQVFYNIVKEYIQTEGTYKNLAKGNIMVSVPNVILKDLTIEGDLIIGDGVGEGDVILDSVKVRGRIVVRGGGENSIIIKGNSDISNIIVAKVDGVVSIKVQGDANVEIIYIDDESDDVNIEGQIGNLQLMASGIIVGAIDSQIKTIDIIGKNSKVIIDKDSKVENININKEAVGIKLEVVGIADKVTTQAPNTQITGKGKVSKVEVKEGGNNAKIETTNTKIQVDKGVTGVTLPPTPPSPSSSGGSSSGGSSSGGITVVSVSAININKSTTTLVEGTTETLTVTFTPSNASNKTITWTTSDASKATIDSTGKVRAVSAGTATITAKSNNGKTATCVVTVTTTVVPVSAISVKGTGDATTIETNGGTLQMIATVSPDNASNKAVTWTVTETDGTATDKATISNTGLLTAVKNGTVKVTATAKDGSGKSGFVNITITNQVGADKNITAVTTLIDKNVAYGTDLAGVSLPTTVGVTLEDSTTRNLAVTWNGGTPSYNGNTAGEYVFEGTLTLEAGVKNTSSLKATIKVIVAPQEKVAPPVITASTTTTTNRDAGVKFTVGTAAGVTFYYTVDGTTPTSSSTKYTGEVTVTAPDVDTVATVNIKVIGIKAGFINSDVVTKPVTYLAKGAATYAVTVTNGTGDGNYVEGATVTITANAADSDKQFDKWTTTDGVVFANANSPNTTFTMPNKAVTVTATYKDIVVTGITVKTPPTKTTYITGDSLELSGLVVTLTKSDGNTEDVAFDNFGTKGITTSPENGTALSVVTTGVTITVNEKTVTQSITVTLPVMTGTVTITGDAKFGSTLTADITNLTNEGTTPTYQWYRGEVAISSATAASYTLVEADIGKKIKVMVTAQESVGTGSITSDPTAVIEKADGPSAPGAPTMASKTDTSITLTANALHQFSKDNGVTWQDSEVFTGLTPSTEYTFVARIKTTTTKKESAASSGINITTSAPAPVSVTDVSLNQTTMSLKVGTGTGTLTATIAPANATNKTVTWESSNTSVATVDSNGKVTPVATGTTTITVTTADGSKTATCTVTVTEAKIATAVFVNGGKELKGDKPYLVNGEPAETGTLGSGGCTAHFKEGILTLHGYNGGEIKNSYADKPDLIIKLIGDNKVIGTQTGISNDDNGDIYITADNDATLTVNTVSVNNFSFAISSKSDSSGSAGSVVIGGKANVVVSAISGNNNLVAGIFARDHVTIQDSANFSSITTVGDSGASNSHGIYAEKNITINTTGDISIDCSGSQKGVTIYANGNTHINNVNLMTLKSAITASYGDGFIGKFPNFPLTISDAANNLDETGKILSYRSGTPYTIEVKNGEITGVAAGVIVQAGQPYQALANDIITIKAKEISNFAFVKWTNQDGTDLDSALFVSPTAANSSVAKIKMPANNLNIKAQYKSTLFTTQPVFHRGDEKITWKISQAADFGYLQKKTGETWGDTSISLPRTLEGTATVQNNPGNHYVNAPDGTYRLAFYFNPNDNEFLKHYSEQFEIAWNAQLAGTVTISGTPKSGATLTAKATDTQVDAGDLKYQWYAGTDKIGTNSNELALTTAHIGKTIKVAVSSHNYNMPIIKEVGVVAKADGPGAIDSYTGTSEVEANIKLAGLGASTPNLEVAVAIDGSTYDEYRDLYVDGDGKAWIFGLTGVNASTKVKVRIKESPTHFAGADREITVTVSLTPLSLTAPTIPTGLQEGKINVGAGANIITELTATGGVTPYTYSLEGTDSGRFTIDSSSGLIGVGTTALTAGTYNFTVKVTDGASATDTKDVTITVAAVDPITASISNVLATNGTVTITLDKKPTVVPIATDFTATSKIYSGVANTLELTGFNYDDNVTVTYNFTPVVKTDVVQNVVVAVTYNSVETLATAFEVEANVGVTETPVITGPVRAGDTSVSGTAVDGATVVLSVNGSAETGVIATGGNWTVSGLTLVENDVIKVTAILEPNTISLEATITVLAAPLGGTVSIDGTLKFGEVLTANTASLTGNTGDLKYAWKRDGVAIDGATASTYTTVEADINKTITVEVTSSVETGTVTGTASGIIKKAKGPSAPPVVGTATDPNNQILVVGGEGKITITIGSNLTSNVYEYQVGTGSEWFDLSTGEITGLTPGINQMFIRLKETQTHNYGASVGMNVTIS